MAECTYKISMCCSPIVLQSHWATNHDSVCFVVHIMLSVGHAHNVLRHVLPVANGPSVADAPQALTICGNSTLVDKETKQMVNGAASHVRMHDTHRHTMPPSRVIIIYFSAPLRLYICMSCQRIPGHTHGAIGTTANDLQDI